MILRYEDSSLRKNMQKPFGAPFADEEIPAIVDYRVRVLRRRTRDSGCDSAGSTARSGRVADRENEPALMPCVVQ